MTLKEMNELYPNADINSSNYVSYSKLEKISEVLDRVVKIIGEHLGTLTEGVPCCGNYPSYKENESEVLDALDAFGDLDSKLNEIHENISIAKKIAETIN